LLWLGLVFWLGYWVLGSSAFFFSARQQSVVATAAGRTRATPGFQGEGGENIGYGATD